MSKKIVLTKQKSAAKTKEGLSLEQEQFCQNYVLNDRELFGNGTQCYLEVYGPSYEEKYKKPMKYLVAMVCASQLLRKPKIIDRINGLLEKSGFNNENVDKQHLFLINQHADLRTKMAAIKEYNALKKRIDSGKLDGAQFNQFNFSSMTNEQLEGTITRIAETLASGKGSTQREDR